MRQKGGPNQQWLSWLCSYVLLDTDTGREEGSLHRIIKKQIANLPESVPIFSLSTQSKSLKRCPSHKSQAPVASFRAFSVLFSIMVEDEAAVLPLDHDVYLVK